MMYCDVSCSRVRVWMVVKRRQMSRNRVGVEFHVSDNTSRMSQTHFGPMYPIELETYLFSTLDYIEVIEIPEFPVIYS